MNELSKIEPSKEDWEKVMGIALDGLTKREVGIVLKRFHDPEYAGGLFEGLPEGHE